MKARFDRGRIPAPFKKGDLVWLRNQNPDSTLDRRRLGPFKVTDMVGNLAARLSDLPQGPSLGRRHPVINVTDLEIYSGPNTTSTSDSYDLARILNHKFISRGKKGHKREVPRYLAKWSDGTVSWEPARSFIDEKADDIVINQSLQDY